MVDTEENDAPVQGMLPRTAQEYRGVTRLPISYLWLAEAIFGRSCDISLDEETIAFLAERLAEKVATLSEHGGRVISLRYGMDGGRSWTLEEVGKEFGVTRERIRQIEAKALRKLRDPSRSDALRPLLGLPSLAVQRMHAAQRKAAQEEEARQKEAAREEVVRLLEEQMRREQEKKFRAHALIHAPLDKLGLIHPQRDAHDPAEMLGRRAHKALLRAHITMVGHVLVASREELVSIAGVGYTGQATLAIAVGRFVRDNPDVLDGPLTLSYWALGALRQVTALEPPNASHAPEFDEAHAWATLYHALRSQQRVPTLR